MSALTLANQLTLLRMLLIPAFVILVVYGAARLGAGRVCASPASPTRSTASSPGASGQKTKLGAWLDPMADKLLLVTHVRRADAARASASPTACRSG